MKANLSRMLRSGVAMLLALCMVAGFIPTMAFAAEDEINYVSLGDSMTNGYCFTGYNQGNISAADFLAGNNVYGNDAYPNLFAQWLETETGKTVNHSKLAVSAMRAEDLNYLLGGRSMPTDGWFSQVEHYSGTNGNALKGIYQDAVTEADVITMSIGNASFGAYLVQYFTRMMGVMGGSLDPEEKVNLEKALSVLNPEQKAVVMEAYNKMMAAAEGYMPEAVGPINVQDLIDIMAYVGAGFILNYEGVLDQIVELNPDVDVVLVGLMNTTYGMEITGEGFDPIPIGDIMDILFDSLNAYIAALPAAYQAAGKWENAEFYYTSMPNPEFIVQVFDDLYEQGWPADLNGLSGATVRARTIKAYNEALAPMIGMALGFDLPAVTLADIEKYVFDESGDQYQITINFTAQALQYDGTNAATLPLVKKYIEATSDYYLTYAMANVATVFAADIEKEISIAIYYALEESLAKSVNNMEITLDGLMGIAGDVLSALGEMPAELNPANNPGPQTIKTSLVKWFTGSDTALAMCKVFAMFKVGDGMSVHPTPAAHKGIYAAIKNAYKNHTVKDETVQNVEIALNELYKLVETYGPEVAAQVWAQWEEDGTIDAVKASAEQLKAELETYYIETALPAIKESIVALTAQKESLTAELAALKAELAAELAALEAELQGYQAELAALAEDASEEVKAAIQAQIDRVTAEIAAVNAAMESAIASVEALIAAVDADIAEMIALAEQIAVAVEDLEKAVADVAAAIEDLENAVNEVINVVKNADGAVAKIINSFKAARDAAVAAVEALNESIAAAEEIMANVDAMIEKVYADAEGLHDKVMSDLTDCLAQIPEEAKVLLAGAAQLAQEAFEAKLAELEAALVADLTKLAEEYGVNEEAIKAELAKLAAEHEAAKAAVEAELAKLTAEYEAAKAEVAAKLAELEAQIIAEATAKHAEIVAATNAQIEAAKAEAAAKLAELEAELLGYQAELAALAEDAAEEAKAAIQAQIDRVNAEIAAVNATLEQTVADLEAAAQAAYEQIVAEVTKAHEEAIAALEQQLAELEATYNAAVAPIQQQIAELKAAHEAAVAAVEQQIAEVKAAYEAAVAALNAAHEAAVAELNEALNKSLEELNKLDEALAAELNAMLNAAVEGALTAVREELVNTQKAVEEILKGNLAAAEALKDSLVEMGNNALVEAGEAVNDAVLALIEEATTADLVIDDEFKYVAIGDGSAAPESYVEKLTAALNAEAAENGVNEIEVVNYAKTGNTVSAEIANLSDVSDADLITVGFSNVGFLQNAMAGKVTLDWADLVGEENVAYVEDMMADVNAELDAIQLTGMAVIDNSIRAKLSYLIEATAYGAVQYTLELPELVHRIRVANPDAVVIIVGMYNPLDGVVFSLGEGATMDVGEYIDNLVDAVAVHGLAYSILTGDSIYVDARDVATVNTDKELAFFGDIIVDIFNIDAALVNFVGTLYPSAIGDDSIADEIADALNITYIKSEVEVLLGDANGDGEVDNKDLVRLRKYLADPETTEIVFANADVNCDGEVDNKDLVRMRKHFADGVALG